MTDLAERLGERIGYRFCSPETATAALSHRSAGERSNERLEFLGDAVIGLAIGEALFEARPDLHEGDLTRMRASLVNRDSLAEVARGLGLDELVLLGAPEQRSGAFQRSSILEDALEAVVGAVFLDGGYAAARDAVRRIFAARLGDLPSAESLKDPKTRLQERLQARGVALPDYALAGSSGPDHARRFRMECRVPELGLVGAGSGKSRRKAEQLAAAEVLKRLPW